MQPASWSRTFVRVGTSWLVAAALVLAGCNSNIPIPVVGPIIGGVIAAVLAQALAM